MCPGESEGQRGSTEVTVGERATGAGGSTRSPQTPLGVLGGHETAQVLAPNLGGP